MNNTNNELLFLQHANVSSNLPTLMLGINLRMFFAVKHCRTRLSSFPCEKMRVCAQSTHHVVR